MGEYAMFKGEQIKIGTCEDMYYLRADQAHLVKPLSGNVDPVKDAGEIRFRFPFPDEDATNPGDFRVYDRGVVVDAPLLQIEHEEVHLQAGEVGLSVPCPASKEGKAWQEKAGVVFDRHGAGRNGDVRIVQQRLIEGKLVLICECVGCLYKYRIPSLEEARPVIEACRKMARAAKRHVVATKFWNAMAARIEQGYRGGLPGAPRKAEDLEAAKAPEPPEPKPRNPYERAYGSKYVETKDLHRTEIAKLIRADIKAAIAKSELPKGKYSVRCESFSGGGSIDVRIKVLGPDFRERTEEEGGRQPMTPEAKSIHDTVKAITDAYNYDGSDMQSDHFDVRFYSSISFES